MTNEVNELMIRSLPSRHRQFARNGPNPGRGEMTNYAALDSQPLVPEGP